jgi:DNA-binding winged helix-turn-helix (wHTH) protein
MNSSTRYLINKTVLFTVSDNTMEFYGATETIEPLLCSVMVCLIENSHRPVTRDELIKKFWGPTVKSDEALMKAISKIRKKFKFTVIKTVNKVGYQWIATVEVRGSINKPVLLRRRFAVDLSANWYTVVVILAVLFLIKTILFPHEH